MIPYQVQIICLVLKWRWRGKALLNTQPVPPPTIYAPVSLKARPAILCRDGGSIPPQELLGYKCHTEKQREYGASLKKRE